MEIRLCTPEEEEDSWRLEEMVWARFNGEADGAVGSNYFHHLHLLALQDGEIIGTIDACPFRWSGDVGELHGWSEMVQASYSFPLDFRPGGEGDIWAGAIGTSIHPQAGSRGLSQQLLRALRSEALEQGYRGVLAPVRPIFRARAPWLSIEEYAELRLPSGKHFDPWVRAHEAIGGKIIGTRNRSASFEGSRDQWESWSGMRLPDNGDFLFPDTIGVLRMRNGRGRLEEPSIWIAHAGGE